MSTSVRFTNALQPSPLGAGVQANGDMLWLYDHRIFLEHTIFPYQDVLTKDRVIAVKTGLGSNRIDLPYATAPDFNFLDSTTQNVLDETQVGDIVFIEEGTDAGGYLVVERDERYLIVDSALTESSGTVYRSDNDGTIQASTNILRSYQGNFTEDDIGRYLTMWACNWVEYDGSYRIISVTDYGTYTEVTLDTDPFPEEEQGIHWVVVKAPTEAPSASGTEGRTSLVGIRPIRIYNGEKGEWRVASVSPHLDRTEAEIYVAHAEDAPPRAGVKQPYQIVRPGLQHISSTGMRGQGRELGLYYFDVLSSSMFGGSVANIPEDTPMEPIFGTYYCEGYRLEVVDTRFTFSSQEQCDLVMTPSFLPVGFEDKQSNQVTLDEQRLRANYNYAPVVDQVQQLFLSNADRVLNASPLTRHFLPAYTYFDVNMQGGAGPSTVGEGLIYAIDHLGPTEALDVSKLETVFKDSSVVRWDHPLTVISLTHDLDRRIVMTRSENKIDDDDLFFNGSNRTSYFIPGTAYVGEEEDIPDGERIYVSKGVTSFMA